MSVDEFLQAALIGIGGTIALDLWALLLAGLFQVPPVNWPMVGRWIGNMPRGQFVHANMAKARAVPGEALIGWGAHYLIGIGYGLLVVAHWGAAWLERPTLLPPLVVSWALLVAPFFLMMPGMGAGVAGSRTPKPNRTRFKSVVGHSVFGSSMYLTAIVLAPLTQSAP